MPNQKRKTYIRVRKASVAAISTSSPFKNALIEKSKKKEEKDNQVTKAKNINQIEKKTKGNQPKEKTKAKNKPADSDDDEMILFDTDSESDALIGYTAPDSEDAE